MTDKTPEIDRAEGVAEGIAEQSKWTWAVYGELERAKAEVASMRSALQAKEQELADAHKAGEQAASSYQSLGEASLHETERLETRIAELEAALNESNSILREQDTVIDGVGNILCRHGKDHDYFKGCLYCKCDDLESKLALREFDAAKAKGETK